MRMEEFLDVVDGLTPVPTMFVLPREGSEGFNLKEWENRELTRSEAYIPQCVRNNMTVIEKWPGISWGNTLNGACNLGKYTRKTWS